MILYHYTAKECLDAILREGLTKGEAPISATHWETAVNLTTDPSPDGHGLDAGGKVVSDDDSSFYRDAYGWNIPAGTRFANKKEVRITIKLPSSDRKLNPGLNGLGCTPNPAFSKG